ncbi:MAG: sulfurtransferase TusA family protein [Dehalococcoidia bacterium]|nr:sulfurtransferase TusA family protein [Dehalococcoidia bacterium]
MSPSPDSPRPDEVLDSLGLHCPVPVWQAAKRIAAMRPGQVLELLSDDPGITEDIRLWCRRTGHHLLDITERGPEFHVLLRKAEPAAKRPASP